MSNQPWHNKEAKIPCGSPQSTSLAQKLIMAPISLLKKTWGHYPAEKAIMASAIEGSMVDFKTASRIESMPLRKLLQVKNAKIS